MLSFNEQLARELFLAHSIIRNALSSMTVEQKLLWGQLNTQEGVHGVGIIRSNERTLLLSKLITPDRLEDRRVSPLGKAA